MKVILQENLPEPWLRGTRTDVPAVVRGVLHALDLAREDVRRACGGLGTEQLHGSPFGLTPIAYHLRHIPRSLDRLLTYAEGEGLSDTQLALLREENQPEVDRALLIREFQAGIDSAEARIRQFIGADLEKARSVGRKGLPTTIGGLLVHLADHTQRHVGQIVTTAKVIRNGGAVSG
ncbi:DinB family protein [Silvibacterium sp.]|uniref:DinB family protein n=1 Tax=Silvibacterium sp. TaxID=1964179 RepID=UPI0039E5D041